jgi:hypothetical protein
MAAAVCYDRGREESWGRPCFTEGMMGSIFWLCSMICRNIFQIFFGCQEKYVFDGILQEIHKYKRGHKIDQGFLYCSGSKIKQTQFPLVHS